MKLLGNAEINAIAQQVNIDSQVRVERGMRALSFLKAFRIPTESPGLLRISVADARRGP